MCSISLICIRPMIKIGKKTRDISLKLQKKISEVVHFNGKFFCYKSDKNIQFRKLTKKKLKNLKIFMKGM